MEPGLNQETMQSQAPAFVLGAGVTALGVLRCLGRTGIPVCSGFDLPQVERWSRWYRRLEVTVRGQRSEDDGFYELLRTLELKQAVLVPCSDIWAERVGALPIDLQQRFVSAQPSKAIHRQFLDKQFFKELLEKFEIPRPKTLVISEQAQPDVRDWDNYFLKPRDSQHFFKEYGKKAHRITNADEARILLDQCRAKGLDCILQEFLPGDASQYFYVEGYRSRQGKITALFARRRLRMYPADFGNSSAMISIPLSEVDQARRSLCGLLEGVNYCGIFSAEFKYDKRDGLSKLLEVNTRPWWYVEFASSCGLNIPLMYYRDALQLEVPVISKYREGKKGVYWYYDWQVYREGKKTNLWSALVFWLCARHTIMVADDPLPGLGFLFELMRKKWGPKNKKSS